MYARSGSEPSADVEFLTSTTIRFRAAGGCGYSPAVSTNRLLLRIGIAVVGAGIALGTGQGVAAAETDASGGGASATSESSQSSPDSPSNPASVSESPKTDAPIDAKESAADKDSTGEPPKDVDKPTTTVSASTVTVRRDDPVDKVATESSLPSTHVTAPDTQPAVKTDTEPVAAEPVAAPDQPSAVVEAPATAVETTASADPQPAESVAPAAATLRSAAAPVERAPRQPGPLATVVFSLLSAFGLLPPAPAVPANVVGVPAQPVPGTSSNLGVTGVKVGRSDVQIPVGSATYTAAADWYFPTQADGTVQAQGVMWLQHGFLGSKSWYSALAQELAQETNSVVVVPNIPSFGFFTCAGCSLNTVAMQQGVADLFADPNRVALTNSAGAAGYQGVLPDKFILTGHSAGGGLAAAAGGFYTDAVKPEDNDLLGVVMYDGVSSNGTFAPALASLRAAGIPLYQIAAPPQAWNANGQTTNDLVTLSPGQFVGAVLANGSHVDSLIGGSPIIDFFSQLFVKRSPPGNTDAVYTFATGWVNDMYAGRGPANPLYGIYGAPDQYIVLGQTAAVVLGPPPVVDVKQYLGTWYELGSVRQFFSIGLVNTTAEYTLNPDGSIRVENSGNYFFSNGPKITIVGAALPVDPDNNKLNVAFFGPVSATPPGNYWIVDLAPDYSWAIVSDSRGSSGFLLSRTRTVSDELYQELLNRASVKGVNRLIIRTRQPAAETSTVSV